MVDKIKEEEKQLVEKSIYETKMEAMEEKLSRMSVLINRVADPEKLKNFKLREMRELERNGDISKRVGIHMFEGKYVLSWSDLTAESHQVYQEGKKLVEVIAIPKLTLYNPTTKKEVVRKFVSYGIFHKTRVFKYAEVKKEVVNKQTGRSLLTVLVEGTNHELTIDSLFIN